MQGLLIANLLRQQKKAGKEDSIAEKKIKGRKRHIIVDTQGFLLGCYITKASISDQAGFIGILDKFYLPCMQKIWVDQAYMGYKLKHRCAEQGIELEVVKRREEGFKILPHRWIVERTFGWMSRYRRLSKDYEGLAASSQNWMYISMIRLMLKRVDL